VANGGRDRGYLRSPDPIAVRLHELLPETLPLHAVDPSRLLVLRWLKSKTRLTSSDPDVGQIVIVCRWSLGVLSRRSG
jgi:hypothetical protein